MMKPESLTKITIFVAVAALAVAIFAVVRPCGCKHMGFQKGPDQMQNGEFRRGEPGQRADVRKAPKGELNQKVDGRRQGMQPSQRGERPAAQRGERPTPSQE